QDLAIAQRLAAAEPQHAGYQRDLSVSYERLGDLMRTLGQADTARQYFEQSLDLRARLAAAEPQRADYQRDLSVSYEKLGNVLHDLGQTDAARQYYEQDLDIAQRLVRAEPQRADYQRDLVISLMRMADAEPQRAQEHLTRALDILHALRAAGLQVYQRDEMIAALEHLTSQT
ncbi:MAG: tetratricopeptide repeat protein, partial [Rhodocyclaceae bacterium]|nr:tetratricopeptide repeat protein [Rhodocyclaceae bacterium]